MPGRSATPAQSSTCDEDLQSSARGLQEPSNRYSLCSLAWPRRPASGPRLPLHPPRFGLASARLLSPNSPQNHEPNTRSPSLASPRCAHPLRGVHSSFEIVVVCLRAHVVVDKTIGLVPAAAPACTGKTFRWTTTHNVIHQELQSHVLADSNERERGGYGRPYETAINRTSHARHSDPPRAH